MNAIAGRLHEQVKLLGYQVLLVCDALLRRLGRKEPALILKLAGAIKPGSCDRLCLFSHFDRQGRIDDYVVYYLSKLSELDCEIVFVSTAENLDSTELEKIRHLCTQMIVRENIGYDFGSWKVGLGFVDDLRRFKSLILANDSVYGPLQDLRPVFEEMENRGLDFWGITDSWRYDLHLHSYFLVLGSAVINDSEFSKFWEMLPHYSFKHSVIQRAEIGLTQKLARAGFRFAALCNYEDLHARMPNRAPRSKSGKFDRPVNSTHYLWEPLIAEFGCPFLKVQMLRDNPKRIPNTDRWDSVIRQNSNYDCSLIERHLARLKAGR